MSAVAERARAVVRANARATVVLALVAGVVGGLVLATWSASRRAESSFDRFLDATEKPDIFIHFCHPDATSAEIESDQGCPLYDPADEAAAIRGLAGVQAVTSTSMVSGVYHVGGEDVPGPVGVALDTEDLPTPEGRPIVTDGRLGDPAKPDEAVIGEEVAALFDVRVGDEVPFTLDRLGDDRSTGEEAGRTVLLQIVGIVRTTRDIAPLTDPRAADYSDSFPIVGRAFWDQYAEGAVPTWPGGGEVRVGARDTDFEEVESAIVRTFPGRLLHHEPIPVPERVTVEDAIGYEVTALRVVAVAGAIAWLLSVGLALLRQSTQEHAEAPMLNALGMTRVQLVGAASLRAAPVALLAGVTVIIVATGLSLVSSIGVASRVEVDRGLHVDPVVTAIGAITVVVLTMMAMVVPAMVPARAVGVTRAPPTAKGVAGLGASLSAGRGLMRSRAHSALSLRLASFTCVIAVACSVAAFGSVGSLRDLTSHPEGYGTSWPAAVWGASDDPFLEGDFDAAVQAVRETHDADAAAGLMIDPESSIGALRVPTIAFWTIVGKPQEWSVVLAGREPRNADEVSLGPKTMRALGVGIDDHISLSDRRVEVVGESLFHDGRQIEPGEVAVVDASWFPDAGRAADNILLRSSAARPDWSPIEDAGLHVVEPPPPAGVRNLMHIEGAPELLGLIVSLLAAAVLTHTVLAFTRTERRQLSILRALGFTRRQVIAAVSSVAVLIVGLGVVIGVPLGRAVQDWLWSTLERRIAFSSPSVWGWEVVAVVAAAVAVGLAIGASAGWLAVRHPAARALRDE